MTESLARAVVAALRVGDAEALRRLLQEHPGLATARLGKESDGENSG